MSAYVVDRNHIWFLVVAAGRLPRGGSQFTWWCAAEGKRKALGLDEEGGDVTPDALGQMLWNENIRSVTHRYPDHKDTGAALVYDRLYQHPRQLGWLNMDPVAVLKACACYSYQSCEVENVRGVRSYRPDQDQRHQPAAGLRGRKVGSAGPRGRCGDGMSNSVEPLAYNNGGGFIKGRWYETIILGGEGWRFWVPRKLTRKELRPIALRFIGQEFYELEDIDSVRAVKP